MAYGLAFQRCLVPDVEDTQVLRIERELSGFRLQLGDGSSYAMAHRVILAVDITHFQVLPTAPTHLLAELLTHSSAHTDVERIRERDVTVMGAGASAIDLAVLPDGGRGQRRPGRSAYDSTVRRSVESSAASVGEVALPKLDDRPGLAIVRVRERAVALLSFTDGCALAHREDVARAGSRLAMKDRFDGRITVWPGRDIENAQVRGDRVCLILNGPSGRTEHTADHVIAVTGGRGGPAPLALPRWRAPFRNTGDSSHSDPLPYFETSISGLYVVGLSRSTASGR